MIGNKRNFSQATCASSDTSSDEASKKKQEVDAEIPGNQSYKVVDGLSCYLMKSDCGVNNNKYYII